MSFTTVCPNCDARLTAPDTVRGKKVKCKKCDEPFVARPAADSDDDEDEGPARPSKANAKARRDFDAPPRKTVKITRKSADDDDEDDKPARRSRDDDEDEDDEPRPKGKKKGKKKKQGSPAMLIALVAIGAVVLIGGGVGVYFGFIKEDKPADSSVAQGDVPKGPGGKGAPTVAASMEGWVELHEPEGRYRVKFPQQPPPPLIRRQQLPNGEIAEFKLHQLETGGETYVAGHLPVPPDVGEAPPDQILDAAVSGGPFQAKGVVVKSRTSITQQGVIGREAVLEDPGKKRSWVVRVFLTKDRLLMLIVAGDNVAPDPPRVKAFFDSFVIE